MKPTVKPEFTRTLPGDIPIKFHEFGKPILTAYGCVLCEHDTGKSYIYTAVNLKTEQSVPLVRRTAPLTDKTVESVVVKLRDCKVASVGKYQADRAFGRRITDDKSREILDKVFRRLLPKYGYKIRDEQISLAEHILETVAARRTTLAEAEVGTGKTLAYLVPAIIAKRGRVNDFWNHNCYPESSFVETMNMPIVVATSSIALQNAIINDYIPALSDMLLQYGIIRTPLTATIRKGRDHYICKHRLQEFLITESNQKTRRLLEMEMAKCTVDLAEIENLPAATKRKISVPGRCYDNCGCKETCPYLAFREEAQSPQIDIQVVNHNYLLADILRRQDNQTPLIPNYQILIIDEAHKFLSAAQTMYGTQLEKFAVQNAANSIFNLNFPSAAAKETAQRDAKKLVAQSKKLWNGLLAASENNDGEQTSVKLTDNSISHISNIGTIALRLKEFLKHTQVNGKERSKKSQIMWELSRISVSAAVIVQSNKNICWADIDGKEISVCSVPKDLAKRIYNDTWSKGVPTVLTSGTLSTNAVASCASDFTRTKATLGLDLVSMKLTEISKPSPFNYRSNAFIYTSNNVQFPDQKNSDYIKSVAEETLRLIQASHGHAAVLFTSYKVMDMVWKQLAKQNLQFPIYRLEKGDVNSIEHFKNSKNGVLFASGAMWEGIDIPGDTLSMLIIVKLPFAVPDPISEYEQTQYQSFGAYRENVIVPEMLIKLKQGFGRLIRTETDSGVIAILDSRVSENGSYRMQVLNALPDCNVTSNIAEVTEFIAAKKSPEYFE